MEEFTGGGSESETVGVTQRAEALLTAGEVAALLGVPLKRVYTLDIPVIQISARTLRWQLSDVVEWREKRRVVR